jgi:hypothetical protein
MRMRTHFAMSLGVIGFAMCAVSARADPTLNVGSKRFTESYILGKSSSKRGRPRARRWPRTSKDSATPPSC